MIDIHNHFIPAIDDGPKTMAESVQLAKVAFDDGVTHAVCTPHIHPGRYENNRTNIAEAVERFKEALAESSVDIEIGFSAEVRVCPEIFSMLDSGTIPLLGESEGYRLLLLEFPHSHIPVGTERLVEKLLDAGIKPVIAHPERNKSVVSQIEKIRPFVEMDCYFQITASSIIGGFGSAVKKSAQGFLENGWVDIIATDAHNLKNRSPLLTQGRIAAEELVGKESANKMVNDNPWSFVSGQFEA